MYTFASIRYEGEIQNVLDRISKEAGRIISVTDTDTRMYVFYEIPDVGE